MNSDQLLHALEDRVWIEVMCPSCAEMFDTVVSVSDYAKRVSELKAQLAAAESALKKIRSINDQNGVIMTGSARDAIQGVTEQYFAQGK